jgi:hypothetical protein
MNAAHHSSPARGLDHARGCGNLGRIYVWLALQHLPCRWERSSSLLSARPILKLAGRSLLCRRHRLEAHNAHYALSLYAGHAIPRPQIGRLANIVPQPRQKTSGRAAPRGSSATTACRGRGRAARSSGRPGPAASVRAALFHAGLERFMTSPRSSAPSDRLSGGTRKPLEWWTWSKTIGCSDICVFIHDDQVSGTGAVREGMRYR